MVGSDRGKALGGDDACRLGAEPVVQAGQQFLAEIVILVEHADLRFGIDGQDLLAEEGALRAQRRLKADGPGKFLRVGELLGARGNEQLRHLFGIQIGAGGEVQRRTQHAEHHGYFVLLDQPAGLLDRFRRAVASSTEMKLILRPLMPPRSLIILK